MSDNERLLAHLTERYFSEYPHAKTEQERAERVLIRGGSHTLRLLEPAPFRIVRAAGSRVWDMDGHEILDFWQGHYTNILGHNPQIVTDALIEHLSRGFGLQSGITDSIQIDFAEVLLRQIGAEKIRFTSSGSLATLYAVMLSRAYTGRSYTLKVGGGWQGGQPFTLKGVSFKGGFDHPETEGLSHDIIDKILLTRYNDPDDLTAQFRRHGDEIACFIVEPWMGMGGFMPAEPEYLRAARELTHRYGAVLIFDEIISGFRFCAGGVHRLYGIYPDLSTYAKIAGGGMPVAAVAGREEILRLCSPESQKRVKFDGGTFSAHPASMLAGKIVVEHLARHDKEIYPRLGALGERMRRGVEEAFAREGVLVRCTGYGNAVVPDSSVGMVHFPHREDVAFTSPEQVWDPAVCDVVRREKALKLALLLERVYVMHGLGALSTEHTEEDLDWLFSACEASARVLKSFE
jgi:glutamate-1-semialdehyde 2,1-aminomutase